MSGNVKMSTRRCTCLCNLQTSTEVQILAQDTHIGSGPVSCYFGQNVAVKKFVFVRSSEKRSTKYSFLLF